MDICDVPAFKGFSNVQAPPKGVSFSEGAARRYETPAHAILLIVRVGTRGRSTGGVWHGWEAALTRKKKNAYTDFFEVEHCLLLRRHPRSLLSRKQ